jgi:hypothetical protein
MAKGSEGRNHSDAKSAIQNFRGDHVGAAVCVVLHDARIVTGSPRTPGELRDYEYRLVVDQR